MFIIITDGMENASRKYSTEKVKQMIERQKEKYGWEFIFLGANIDAVEAAGNIGIPPAMAVDYHCDSQGTKLNYDVISDAVCAVRACGSMASDWRQRIDEDFKARRRK
jgi:hypothetical protein